MCNDIKLLIGIETSDKLSFCAYALVILFGYRKLWIVYLDIENYELV